MPDDDLAPDAGLETATPLPGADTATEELDTDIEDLAGADDDDPETDFEAEDGQKYRINKNLVPYLMRNKDYTQKSQDRERTFGDRSKALEARQAEIEERTKAADEELDARADLRVVSKRLESYQKLTATDWAHHRAQDPVATENAWTEFQLLKDQKAELQGKVTKAQSDRTARADADLGTRVQQALAEAPKFIPNFKPETQEKIIGDLMTFAHSEGIPEHVLKANWGPQMMKLLHYGKIGKAAVEKAKAPKAADPPPEPPPRVKPRGSTSQPGLHDGLSTNTWIERFNERRFGKKG